MRGYRQFCPVALGAEVFAERWTPLILRELLLGSHRFSELRRGLPRISRNLLTSVAVVGPRELRSGFSRLDRRQSLRAREFYRVADALPTHGPAGSCVARREGPISPGLRRDSPRLRAGSFFGLVSQLGSAHGGAGTEEEGEER
jgi:hypothetical protein